jgi:hypothetical protein
MDRDAAIRRKKKAIADRPSDVAQSVDTATSVLVTYSTRNDLVRDAKKRMEMRKTGTNGVKVEEVVEEVVNEPIEVKVEYNNKDKASEYKKGTRKAVIRASKEATAIRNAHSARSSWFPNAPYPIQLLIVPFWDHCMSKTIPESLLSCSVLKHQKMQREGQMYVRIRVLLQSVYHKQAVPALVPHKSLQNCMPTDRLVDVGFVVYQKGCGLIITAARLQQGLIEITHKHLLLQVPMYMGYPTTVHIVLMSSPDNHLQSTHETDYLTIIRSRCNRMLGTGLMVLLICTEQGGLWDICTDPMSYQPLMGGVDLQKACSGWYYVRGRALLTGLTRVPSALHFSSFASPNNNMANLCRVQPSHAVHVQWLWADNSTITAGSRYAEVTLQQLEDTLGYLFPLLDKFARARAVQGKTAAPDFNLWYTRESRVWTKRMKRCMDSHALIAARQLLLGSASVHGAEVYELAVMDWVALCACALACLLEQGDASAMSYVVKTSRAQYAMWNDSMKKERKNEEEHGTVDVLDLLRIAAGRRMLSQRRIKPTRGRVKISEIPELALPVTMHQLEEMLRRTCATPLQISSLRGKLAGATENLVKSYLRVDLHRRTDSAYRAVQDAHKMTVEEFMFKHAGVCVYELLTGQIRLGNTARYRLMSILHPYTKRSSILEYMTQRLGPQWCRQGNGPEKLKELSRCLDAMRTVPKHNELFLNEFCTRKGEYHRCVYGWNHPYDTLQVVTPDT